jgi:hypothetical protein
MNFEGLKEIQALVLPSQATVAYSRVAREVQKIDGKHDGPAQMVHP